MLKIGLLGCIITRNNVKSFTFTVYKKLLLLQHVCDGGIEAMVQRLKDPGKSHVLRILS
jgi:hypothetical protein